ncbi:ATPase [Haloarcula rubripromontorii]|uniref:ATPase n=1 Tax=Haloarcula rubripromontorii TaxID=1705562 RepID=UPI001EE4331D|nr:ATPase [Haloarcula rubripromontorii]
MVGLAPDDDRILLAECKWTSEPVGHALVTQLGEKTERVRWGSNTRDVEFALFSRNGFVEGLANDIDSDWSPFGPSEVETLL